MNLYTYCHNNPIIGVDPSGHNAFTKWCKNRGKDIKALGNDIKKGVKTVGNGIKDGAKYVYKDVFKPGVKKGAKIAKKGVDYVESFTSQLDFTYSKGYNFSVMTGIWSYNGSVGISLDSKGNIGVQYSKGVGVGTGTPSLSLMNYKTYTNAENIFGLNDNGFGIGGSVSVDFIGGGKDLTFGLDNKDEIAFAGYSRTAGLVLPIAPIGGEVHYQYDYTDTFELPILKTKSVNVYDLFDKAYNKIMEW